MERMERRLVGTTGVEVSRIGLGGYELGPEPDEAPDVERAVRVIGAAIESGINWLDTSENYLATRNEEVIGAALQKVSDEFLVASKVAPGAAITGGGSGFRREQVLQACRESLKRLRRDHLDIYFLHWPDDTGIPLEETWAAMAELAENGLVRAPHNALVPGQERRYLVNCATLRRCNPKRTTPRVATSISPIR